MYCESIKAVKKRGELFVKPLQEQG